MLLRFHTMLAVVGLLLACSHHAANAGEATQELGVFKIIGNGSLRVTLVVDGSKRNLIRFLEIEGTALGHPISLSYDEAKIRAIGKSGRDEVVIHHLGLNAMTWRPTANLTAEKCGTIEIGFLKGIGDFKRVKVNCLWDETLRRYVLEYKQPQNSTPDRVEILEVTLKEVAGIGPVGIRKVEGLYGSKRIPIRF